MPKSTRSALLAGAAFLGLISGPVALAQQVTGTPGSPEATTTIPGAQLPAPDPAFGGVIKEKASESTPWWAPRIVPPNDGPTAYLIVMREESHSFRDFGDFVAELTTRLNGTTAMAGFTASGNYDGDSNELKARSIVVLLK